MKARSDFLGLLLCIIVLASCAEKNKPDQKTSGGPVIISNPEYGIWQNEENPVEFELIDEFSFTDENDYLVASIWFFDQDSEGISYFIDLRQTKLFALTPEGKISWMIDKNGSGPGDLENVMGLAVKDEAIYVANINGTRIDVFDFSGNYQKSYNLDSDLRLSSDYGFSDNGDLVVGQPYWDGIGEIISVLKVDTSEIQKINTFKLNFLKVQEVSLPHQLCGVTKLYQEYWGIMKLTSLI